MLRCLELCKYFGAREHSVRNNRATYPLKPTSRLCFCVKAQLRRTELGNYYSLRRTELGNYYSLRRTELGNYC